MVRFGIFNLTVPLFLLLVLPTCAVKHRSCSCRPCTWDDLAECEEKLTKYVHNPENWDVENPSYLYCDFVQLRMQCLDELKCDKSNPGEDMPINITKWMEVVVPRAQQMVDYNLCRQPADRPVEYDATDPCDEYFVTKKCTEAVSHYLKTPFSMTCAAMMKAAKCFPALRDPCGRSEWSVYLDKMPYHLMALKGHCRMYYDPSILEAQEKWREEHSDDYFEYFN
ncbi:uncharacterized protein [Ptychodera flava]|uniref:uncharacterized protein n=1 Tax=Ptychodera flava TaxID=63121 RepID=UPI00396A85C4